MSAALVLALVAAAFASVAVGLGLLALLSLPRAHVRTDPACVAFAGPGRWVYVGRLRVPTLRHWLFMRGRGRSCPRCARPAHPSLAALERAITSELAGRIAEGRDELRRKLRDRLDGGLV